MYQFNSFIHLNWPKKQETKAATTTKKKNCKIRNEQDENTRLLQLIHLLFPGSFRSPRMIFSSFSSSFFLFAISCKSTNHHQNRNKTKLMQLALITNRLHTYNADKIREENRRKPSEMSSEGMRRWRWSPGWSEAWGGSMAAIAREMEGEQRHGWNVRRKVVWNFSMVRKPEKDRGFWGGVWLWPVEERNRRRFCWRVLGVAESSFYRWQCPDV